MALLKGRKSFSMIIRSEQGKRLADHLVEIEVTSYLNRKTVQLANGVGVRSQEIADYLGISIKAAAKHLRNSELRQARRGGTDEVIWLYDGIRPLSVDALQIDGIATEPYNYQPVIDFFTNAHMAKKLHRGETVSTAEVAQALDEVPSRRFDERIKFLSSYLGIVQQRTSRPYDNVWYKEGAKQLPKAHKSNKDPESLELIRQFLMTPTVEAKLTDGRGISSKEIAIALDLPWDGRKIFSYVNALKDELGIKKVVGLLDKRWWIKNDSELNQRPTVLELLKEFFSRPEIVVKLANGEGVTSRFIAESLDVGLKSITGLIGRVKGDFDLVQFTTPYGNSIWVKHSVEPIAIREHRKHVHKTLAEFLDRPDIAQRLADGTGIFAREIKADLNLDRSTNSINKALLTLKDELLIKSLKAGNSKVWINKEASYRLAKIKNNRPSSLSVRFPSGLTLEEFFTTPSIVKQLTDGRGVASTEIIDALGLDSQQKASLGQRLRHSSKYLGIKRYVRGGDRQVLWMREGIKPTPNFKKTEEIANKTK